MPVTEYLNYILAASFVTGGLSIYYFVAFFGKLKKLELMRSTRKFVGLLVFSMATGLSSFVLIGTQGYQALTHEEKIASVVITPIGTQKFIANIDYIDGTSQKFELQGDELMIEANILKWKPWSNILGLKTAYRLDRIRGRYQDISDEKSQPATLFSIQDNDGSDSDIANWREQHEPLSFLLDVEHGSASFVSANEEKSYNLFVTINGLLLREIK